MGPTTVVLVVGLAIGADLTGGVPGLLALYAGAAGFCAAAGLWGVCMALAFRTQQAGPLMQQGVFLAVFLSTAYTPEVLLRGWLADVAHLNPVTQVLELCRQRRSPPSTPASPTPGRDSSRWRACCSCSARSSSSGCGG